MENTFIKKILFYMTVLIVAFSFTVITANAATISSSINITGDMTTEPGYNTAYTYDTNTKTLTLIDDMVITGGSILFYNDGTTTIDLNGHDLTITHNGAGIGTDNSTVSGISIVGDGNLTITSIENSAIKAYPSGCDISINITGDVYLETQVVTQTANYNEGVGIYTKEGDVFIACANLTIDTTFNGIETVDGKVKLDIANDLSITSGMDSGIVAKTAGVTVMVGGDTNITAKNYGIYAYDSVDLDLAGSFYIGSDTQYAIFARSGNSINLNVDGDGTLESYYPALASYTGVATITIGGTGTLNIICDYHNGIDTLGEIILEDSVTIDANSIIYGEQGVDVGGNTTINGIVYRGETDTMTVYGMATIVDADLLNYYNAPLYFAENSSLTIPEDITIDLSTMTNIDFSNAVFIVDGTLTLPEGDYSKAVFIIGEKGEVTNNVFDNAYTVDLTTIGAGIIIYNGIDFTGRTITLLSEEPITFTFLPANGYQVANVVIDGESVGAIDSYTIEYPSAGYEYLIEATFEEIPQAGGDDSDTDTNKDDSTPDAVSVDDAVETGDETNLNILLALMIASILGISYCVYRKSYL